METPHVSFAAMISTQRPSEVIPDEGLTLENLGQPRLSGSMLTCDTNDDMDARSVRSLRSYVSAQNLGGGQGTPVTMTTSTDFTATKAMLQKEKESRSLKLW